MLNATDSQDNIWCSVGPAGRHKHWQPAKGNAAASMNHNHVLPQLDFMQGKCAQAAELLGLHAKAKQVQSRDYIAGNKRVMMLDLTARKQQRLQAEQPRAIECVAA